MDIHFYGTRSRSLPSRSTFPARSLEEKLAPYMSWDLFQYNSTSSIQRRAPIFFSSNYYRNIFFLNPECQRQSIIHRRFRHFWRHFQRIGLTSSQFWIKSGVEVRWKRSNNLENGEEYILFFLRMTLDCLKCVHQFKESILRRFFIERERTRSHFDGIRFRPFEKRTERNPFY